MATSQRAVGAVVALSPSTACDGCRLSEVEKDLRFRRCSACLAVWYCSQECQRKVWPTHKLICRQSRQQPADDLHESRLHFNFAANDVAEEEEGDDAEGSYSGSDDDEDHYSGYKPAEFEPGVNDLDQRLRHLSVSGAGVSSPWGVTGGMRGSQFGGVLGSPVDELEDRDIQLAIQASIKEEEERAKKEEDRKKEEEETKKREDEIRKSQDEMQAFYRRSLAKSREGGLLALEGEGLTGEVEVESEDDNGHSHADAVDDDDLLYGEDEVDSDDFDELGEDDDYDEHDEEEEEEEEEDDQS